MTEREKFLAEILKRLPKDEDGAVRYEDLESVLGSGEGEI